MNRNQKRIFILITIAFLQLVYPHVVFSAEIKNVTITQLGNRVLLEFDVEGKEPEANVDVMLTIEGKKYPSDSLHLEGDFGKVAPGIRKRVYWNVLQEFPRGFTGEIQWEILSKGKRAASGKETVVLRDIQKSKPPVTFSHVSHSQRDDCRVCHHKDALGAEQKCSKCHGGNRDGKMLSLKETFHTQCKGCHQKTKKGPVKCDDCHKR